MNDTTAPAHRYLADTHQVENVSRELADYNMYAQGHRPARGRAARGRSLGRCGLLRFGQLTGSAEYLSRATSPTNTSPNWRRTTASATASTWSSSTRPTTADGHGHRARPAFLALTNLRLAPMWRAAGNYLQTQVEAGHGCPITMTFAAIPALRLQPDLAALWEPQDHRARVRPAQCARGAEAGVTIGMAMTENRAAPDVQANSTRAPTRGPGRPPRASV